MADGFEPFAIDFGDDASRPRMTVEVLGYQHPDTAEPANLDLLRCRILAHAHPVEASFDMTVGLWEILEVRDYLQSIVSGNGPSQHFTIAGGLLSLSFAPSRRGPVLCAVMLKTIDASHVRLEFLVTLEPQDINRTLFGISRLAAVS